MDEPENGKSIDSESGVGNTLYKKDFWRKENLNYSRPHYRMEKVSRLINRLAPSARSARSLTSVVDRLP